MKSSHHSDGSEITKPPPIITVCNGRTPEPELVIAADQPFLYLIRHRDSGLVLFAGHVTDPTA